MSALLLAFALLAAPKPAAVDTPTPRIEIRHSDHAEYNGLTRQIILVGAVHVVRATMSLKADRIEVFLSEDQKSVVQAVATGRVEIVDGTRKSRANKAVFDNVNSELILTGDPKLWDGKNRLEADRIVYSLVLRTMRAEGKVRGLFQP